MMQGLPLLSLAIWTPIIAGVAVLFTGGDRNAQAARVIALVGAVLGFAVTLPLYAGFNPQQGGFQFTELKPWIESFNINYHLGIDGISLLLILLNSFTTVLVVIAGWAVIQSRVSQYMAAFLVMSGLMNGVFVTGALSLFLLPPRPQRTRPWTWLVMVGQWALLPVTFIVFGAMPALDAQTRFMLGKYLGFNVTKKHVESRT